MVGVNWCRDRINCARRRQHQNIGRLVTTVPLVSSVFQPDGLVYWNKTKRDFGVDGFTQKISNVPRNCPGYNYKQIKMTKDGAAVLLQKDNSYLDVGPGQYEPTRGPAIHASRHAPPQIPLVSIQAKERHANGAL